MSQTIKCQILFFYSMRKKNLINLPLGLALALNAFWLTPAFSQSDLQQGWDYFNKNNIPKAREYFTKATADNKDKAEAYLVLSLMATVDRTSDEAFKDFEQFYNASDNPYPYLDALWTSDAVMNGFGRKTDEQIAFLQKLLADPKLDGTMKAKVHSMLGDHFEKIQQDKKADEEFSKIQSIEKWQLAGEFENLSGSGFDKDFGPLEYPKSTSGFTNKYKASVNWINLPPNRRDKWVDFTYVYYGENSIIYAQSFVNSPIDQEVQLRVGVSGSLKTWVNDNLLYTEREERNNDLDSYIFTAKLKKGYNRILIQIGSSEITNSNFMARITDPVGNPIEGLTATAEPQPYIKDVSFKSKAIPSTTEIFFQKKIAEAPNKEINYLMLSSYYMDINKFFESRKTLLEGQKLAPGNSYIYYKLASLYSRDDDRTNLEIAIAWLKDNDPDNPVSLNLQYQEQMDKEDYKAATALVDKIEKLYGQDESTLEKRINLASKNGKQDEIIGLVKEGYKKYPDNYYFVDLQVAVETEVNKDYSAAISTLKKYLKAHSSGDAYMKLAECYFKKGKTEDGIGVYKTMIEKNPNAVGYVNDLAGVYFEQQQYEKAEEYYKKCISMAPYISSYWESLAKTYDNEKRTADAISAYKSAIMYQPNDYESRRSLRKLENKKEVFEYFNQPDMTAIYKNAPEADKYPEDNSLILDEDIQKVVYSGGASEERYFLGVKMFNAEGVDLWKEYTIPQSNSERLVIEKAEVIKKNGSRVTAETNDNKVVFTSLEIGDAISLQYHTEEYQIGKLSPYFSDKRYFSHRIPYLKMQYSLLISPDVKFTYRFSGDSIAPKVKDQDEFKMYTWKQENHASLKAESRMPRMTDVAQVMYISSFPDWTYVSNWYYDLASTKAKSDFEVKETVAELMKGNENAPDLKKVELIYNYIVKNIRYSSVSFLQSGLIPQKASKVINTKIGDCKDVATLFVAMCKEVNVPAQLVLVNTKNNGQKTMLLPSIGFNHCIAKCTVDHKDYYVELTSDYLPFNCLYSNDIGSFALDIKSSADKSVSTPFYLDPSSRKPNSITRITNLEMKDDDVVVERTTYRLGQFAANTRGTYRDMGAKEREKEMLKSITDQYANVQLSALDFKGLSDRNDSVIYKYTYTGSDAVTHVGGLSLISLPWVDKATSKDFVFENNRQFPMDVSGWNILDKEVETINFTLPAGKKLSEVPQNINYSCSVADYTVKFKVVNNKITATREIKFKEDKVPVAKIPEFRDFYKKVITADARQIAFK